jgi:hypothetical protein
MKKLFNVCKTSRGAHEMNDFNMAHILNMKSLTI